MKDNSAVAEINSHLRPNSRAAVEFDIRPIFAAGQSPCGLIDETIARLKPNQDLILLAPFEPIPLFTKLATLGFDHRSEKLPDGSWRILFERTSGPEQAPRKAQPCCCVGE